MLVKGGPDIQSEFDQSIELSDISYMYNSIHQWLRGRHGVIYFIINYGIDK